MSAPLRFHGRVAHVFPDDFDVDEIIGAENIRVRDPEVLAAVCMRDLDPEFGSRTRPGDLLVAGRNFGHGHPHDQAMIAMRAHGVVCVLADSFAPMFERSNSFLGLPLLTCPGISASARRGEEIAVDWEAGTVALADGRALSGSPPSPRTIEIARAGGWQNL